ncbi:hypothetical protein PFISCL1PPCAC_7159, partial [Pristionchus fissidentatus]
GRGTEIEEDFYAKQASNGTVFYMKYGKESSIYFVYNGQKVRAIKSWDGEIGQCECFGDALYFMTGERKIYTATINPHNEIHITFIRELEKDESCYGYMLFGRNQDGKEVVYRACDD